MDVQHWMPDQWAAFAAVTVAGLAAVALFALAIHTVRGWTAPAPLRRATLPRPRPTIALAARRAPAWVIEAGGSKPGTALTGEYTVIVEDVDPQSAAGTVLIEAGPAAIAATPPDPDLLTSVERAAELDAWITATAAEVGPALDAALSGFRAAVEPAMRTARLWELRGEDGLGAAPSARVALNRWRIDTPTGEYPFVRPRDVAAALLVS